MRRLVLALPSASGFSKKNSPSVWATGLIGRVLAAVPLFRLLHRRLAVTTFKPGVSQRLYLRPGRTLLFLALVIGLIPGPAKAADRALIMAISDYERAPLPGAKIDRSSVKEILRRMEVSLDNVRVLEEHEQTAAGVKQAVARLAAETAAGDRVFIFFSGQGTSRMIKGQCQQALVSRDMSAIDPADFQDALNVIKDKASKVVMLIDACHSGGVVAEVGKRSLPGSTLRPRFVAPDQAAEQCSKPVNVVEERITTMRSTRGVPVGNNFLYIASAQANEVAFDDEKQGGLATASFLFCLKNGAKDQDRSGSISFKELADCAQSRLEASLSHWAATHRPHHLRLVGNADMPVISQPAVAASANTADPVATLRDLQNAADSRWAVLVEARPPKARIHRDAFQLSVTSGEDGFLTLLYVGSDGKEFMQLFPSTPGQLARVSAGVPFRIPGEFASHGPAGTNHVLAIVSATPRDFSKVLGQQGSAAATGSTAVGLQEQTRNLKHKQGSTNKDTLYGASLVQLVEEQ